MQQYPPRLDSKPHFEVWIVGAGISGAAAPITREKQCPATNFVVFERAGERWTEDIGVEGDA